MNKLVFICCLTIALASCAAETKEIQSKTINEQCAIEMHAARTAIRLRDQKKPASQLRARLKPQTDSSSRLLNVMHEIVDEAYSFKQLNEITYAVYRFEICQRQLQKLTYPASLTPQIEELLICQSSYGTKSSEKHTRCVTQTIDRHSIKTGVDNATIN